MVIAESVPEEDDDSFAEETREVLVEVGVRHEKEEEGEEGDEEAESREDPLYALDIGSKSREGFSEVLAFLVYAWLFIHSPLISFFFVCF